MLKKLGLVALLAGTLGGCYGGYGYGYGYRGGYTHAPRAHYSGGWHHAWHRW